jgi:hypothetical protein
VQRRDYFEGPVNPQRARKHRLPIGGILSIVAPFCTGWTDRSRPQTVVSAVAVCGGRREGLAMMEPPDDLKQRLSFYLAKQKDALEKAGATTDARTRRSRLNLAENYGFLAETMQKQLL